MPPVHTLHVVDYCIFGVTIVVSLGIGVFFALSGGKQRTTSEYFVGNRQMSILPVATSLMVSFESSIMMIGTPAEAYAYGVQWIIRLFGFLVANLLSIIIVVPLIHPLKITSAYEVTLNFELENMAINIGIYQMRKPILYLNLRFSNDKVRLLGSILGILKYIVYMGIVLFGPAIALEGVTGLPQWVSIVSVALASVIYTSIGGLKAVIWTDVFQYTIMLIGLIAVLIKGTLVVGGIGKTWEIAYNNGRVNIFNFDPDPTIRQNFWSLFIGGSLWGFGLVFNQASIQRISATRTLSDARKVMWCVGPGHCLTLGTACVAGIVCYAFYHTQGCDPLVSKQISNPNQLIPYMVMEIFQNTPGMPGLFIASLFSASLSTLSSGLSSISALLWVDFIKPHTKPMSELKATIISKISVVFIGGVIVAVAFLVAMVGGTLIQIAGSTISAFSGPLTGLFLFGIFCPWGNATGAIWGTIMSVVFTFILAIGQMTTKGAVKNQKLPSAPIDSCPVDMFDGILDNTTITSFNDTMMTTLSYMTTTMMSSGTSSGIPEPEGIRRMFMLSFNWFSTVGALLTIVIATIITFCTGYKKPGEVERKYLLSFFDSLFPCLPECIRKPLRCGYEYGTDEQDGEKEADPFSLNLTIVVKADVDEKPTNCDITKVTEEKINGNIGLVEQPTPKQGNIAASAFDNTAYSNDTDENKVVKEEARKSFGKSVEDAVGNSNELGTAATVVAGSNALGGERL